MKVYRCVSFPHARVLVASDETEITVIQTRGCKCCEDYKGYLSEHGFRVYTIYTEDLFPIKRGYQIPPDMESCHTAIVEGYFVEGHMPVEAIKALLEEKPDIRGIILPGMPAGSPGMPGKKDGVFMVYALSDGKTREFRY